MSIVFYCKEFNDHDLGDSESPLRKKFNAIIKDLEENKFTYQGSIELIPSDGGNQYLRAKLSYKGRLLFTQTKHNNKDIFVMLEVIPNHDYHKSKFLTNKEKIKNIKIIDQNSKEVSDNADTVEIKDVQRAHWLGKLVTFSATQEDIVESAGRCELPLVISGAAGSGKTSVALESLRKIKERFKGGKILYVTKSENLIKESKKLFEDETTGELKTYVPGEIEFLSIHEFFEKIIKKDLEGKKPINRSKFFSWFNEICKKDKFKEYKKDGEKIFEEFTAVIGGGGLLGEDGKGRYAEQGNRQSIFPKDKRDSIYDFFEEYRKFIEEDREYYDPNLIAHRCTGEEIRIYDVLVIDEVQDLTESTLGLTLKSLKNESRSNFLLCGDVNQVIHPSFFSLSKLRSFLCEYIENKGSKVFYTLEKNHRNSEQVIELANRALHLKNYCFASEDKMTADEKEAFFTKSDTKNTGNVSFITKDKEQEIAEKVPKSINWAVLVLDDESKKNASKLFDTPLVFNIHEAKGLEFENVILYKFMSCKAYNEIWNIICPDKGKREIENTINKVRDSYNEKDVNTSRNKDKENKSFEKYKFYMNALYVGVTRAIDSVYIIDDEKQCNLLKVIEPGETGNVDIGDIKREESSPKEWKDKALDLIDKGNIEQAKNIAKILLNEKEYAQEIMNALETRGCHKEAQELQFSLDKDKSEQAVKLFPESRIDTENPSSQSSQERSMGDTESRVPTKEAGTDQKRKSKKHKAKQNLKEKKLKLEEDERLMGIIRNDEIGQFKTMDISQYDKQEMLDLALKHRSLYIASYLIEYKGCTLKDPSLHIANRSTKDKELTFLHVAAREGHKGVVALLLDKGAKVNAETEKGHTPLHIAAGNGHKDVVKLLLDKGAKISAKAEIGLTSLHIAAEGGHKDVVALLLDKGAEVNAEANTGHTPLHIAAENDRKDVVALLLDKGAKVNAETKKGYTPLHIAAESGHKDVVALLLDKGAEVNAKTNTGYTPLALALEHSYSKVVDLLLANPNINVGCIEVRSVKKKEDQGKLIQKSVQDRKLFYKVKEAAEEKDESKLDKLLEEIKDLLKPEGKYGFKPSLNYSPDDENTTIKIAIKSGGKILQLLYDYAEKNIGADTKIFKQLKHAKEQQENFQSMSDLCDISVSSHLTRTQGF
ncbi:MAG: ankyrin repeat domain-containing protein [Rickettsiales bacterium]|jgi:ankyrin repeat protein|nr:ankyrin repeat domain-containing protein [Rickettsiales bacterium]MDR1260867.1 ankyrin repeat domain-containing protein [Rickettsiales bacterium]